MPATLTKQHLGESQNKNLAHQNGQTDDTTTTHPTNGTNGCSPKLDQDKINEKLKEVDISPRDLDKVDPDKLVVLSHQMVKHYSVQHYNMKFRIHEEEELDEETDLPIKCSAVHTLERDMPEFDYRNLVDELKERILDHHHENPGLYSHKDISRCKHDPWHVARYVLRNKLNVDDAFNMLSKAMKFNNESLVHNLRPEDFPAEFYQIGGLFEYEPDRKGNHMLYIRAKIHRRVPEVQLVLQAFMYKIIADVDELARGRGIAVVIDCQGGGIVNADMETLLFFVSVLRNYFPKGLSYILVHELPWILKPFWLIAKNWISDEQAQLIKFSNSNTICEYIGRKNLPDFLGGTCERDYRAQPDGCTTLYEASKLWGIEHDVVRKLLVRYQDYLPKGAIEEFDEQLSMANGEKVGVAENDVMTSSTNSGESFPGWLGPGSCSSSIGDSDEENKPAL